EVTGRGGADDATGHARPPERPSDRDLADADAVAVAHRLQRPEQPLEQIPAAELLDDELVFGERSVLERPFGLRLAEPGLGEEAAEQMAIGQKLDAAL